MVITPGVLRCGDGDADRGLCGLAGARQGGWGIGQLEVSGPNDSAMVENTGRSWPQDALGAVKYIA